ncbi:hypothetical protein MKX01_011734 [Papaver californicum]|nr:hypothetical protein MKX01_011734 [Papaver californicum]
MAFLACGEFNGGISSKNMDIQNPSKINDPPTNPQDRLKLLEEPSDGGPTIVYVPTRKETVAGKVFLYVWHEGCILKCKETLIGSCCGNGKHFKFGSVRGRFSFYINGDQRRVCSESNTKNQFYRKQVTSNFCSDYIRRCI